MMLGLPLLLASAAAALTGDHGSFAVIGWNKQCSVAFEHYIYPKLGEAMAAEPIETRIGTLTIPSEEPRRADERLTLSLTGARSWEADQARRARAKLKKEGWSFPGFVETIRPAPVAARRDLPRLILSTDTFRSPASAWPGPPWRASAVYYSPFASECALLVYTAGVDKLFYKPFLFRIGNPIIRADRALAHVTNGLLLLEKGDEPGALAEETIAATLAPDFGPARYHHAALLAVDGQPEPAIDELAAAIAIDPKHKKEARKDKNFEGLRWHPRFGELTR